MISVEPRESSALRVLATGVLDLFFPPHCAVCEKSLEKHEFICAACLSKIERVEPPFCRCGCALPENIDICPDCAGHLWYFDQARSYGYYEEENILGKLIKTINDPAAERTGYDRDAGFRSRRTAAGNRTPRD